MFIFIVGDFVNEFCIVLHSYHLFRTVVNFKLSAESGGMGTVNITDSADNPYNGRK